MFDDDYAEDCVDFIESDFANQWNYFTENCSDWFHIDRDGTIDDIEDDEI